MVVISYGESLGLLVTMIHSPLRRHRLRTSGQHRAGVGVRVTAELGQSLKT